MNFEEHGEASFKKEKCIYPILENTCNIFVQEENTKTEINKIEGNLQSSFWLTVVVVYINIMKTTFYLNLDFYQDFKQHGYVNIQVNPK